MMMMDVEHFRSLVAIAPRVLLLQDCIAERQQFLAQVDVADNKPLTSSDAVVNAASVEDTLSALANSSSTEIVLPGGLRIPLDDSITRRETPRWRRYERHATDASLHHVLTSSNEQVKQTSFAASSDAIDTNSSNAEPTTDTDSATLLTAGKTVAKGHSSWPNSPGSSHFRGTPKSTMRTSTLERLQVDELESPAAFSSSFALSASMEGTLSGDVQIRLNGESILGEYFPSPAALPRQMKPRLAPILQPVLYRLKNDPEAHNVRGVARPDHLIPAVESKEATPPKSVSSSFSFGEFAMDEEWAKSGTASPPQKDVLVDQVAVNEAKKATRTPQPPPSPAGRHTSPRVSTVSTSFAPPTASFPSDAMKQRGSVLQYCFTPVTSRPAPIVGLVATEGPARLIVASRPDPLVRLLDLHFDVLSGNNMTSTSASLAPLTTTIHTGAIQHCSAPVSGKLVCVCTAAGEALVFDPTTGKAPLRLHHTFAAYLTAFSPTGRLLAVATEDGWCTVWQLRGASSASVISTYAGLQGHKHITVLAWGDSFLGAGSVAQGAVAWHPSSTANVVKARHASAVHSISFDLTGQHYLLSGCAASLVLTALDTGVQLLTVPTTAPIWQTFGTPFTFVCCSFLTSALPLHIIVCSSDRAFRVIRLLHTAGTLMTHTGELLCEVSRDVLVTIHPSQNRDMEELLLSARKHHNGRGVSSRGSEWAGAFLADARGDVYALSLRPALHYM